ncbi:MAG: hypothetical protein GF398_07120 [Chitinivibrionales bacterium]|nr:hypothetical protein [Chitinivibrionales bacterium]
MQKTYRLVLLGCALLVSSVHSVVNLESIYSRAVKEQPAVTVNTVVKELSIRTEVVNGLAKTNLILELMPDNARQYVDNPGSITLGPGGRPVNSSQPTWQEKAHDSIEISLSMNFPEDFVAESLYLWIEGQKVAGQIQDRQLAREQYNEIVGRRMDPALLELWGNGYYNLRIFPAESRKSRKVEIVLHHTFDDDSAGLIQAALPFAYDTSRAYYYGDPGTIKKKPIGKVSYSVYVNDNTSYRVNIPGFANGTASISAPFKAVLQNVYTLSAGSIETVDPGGANSEFAWQGIDKLDGHATLGFATLIEKSTVDLQDEPVTRTIVFDIRNEYWNWGDYYNKRNEFLSNGSKAPSSTDQDIRVLQRAKKFAILCLKQYVADDQKFNLVFSGASATMLFDSPQKPTGDNLSKAYSAIVAAQATGDANLKEALKTALDQDGEGVVILISDLYEPYNYQKRILNSAKGGNSYEPTAAGVAYDEFFDSLKEMVSSSDVAFFSIEDDYRFSTIANAARGYRLASLRNDYYYYAYHIYDANGMQKKIPKLPDLFMGGYRYGISDMTVTTSSNSVGEIVYSYNSFYPMYYDDIMIARPMAKSSSLMPYPYWGEPSVMLYVAARAKGKSPLSGPYPFSISGTLGGLSFTKDITARPLADGGSASDVQWSFRKSEGLAQNGWHDNAARIKEIGKNYHIVTRQTSLLALEPWMKMWTDTNTTREQQNAGFNDAIAPQAAMTGGGGQSYALNDVSVSELIGMTPVDIVRASQDVSPIRSIVTAYGISIKLPVSLRNTDVHLSLFQVDGSRVASQVFASGSLRSDNLMWRLDTFNRLGDSFYILEIKSGDIHKRLKLPAIR